MLLLAQIERDLRVLAWQKTTDGQSERPQNYPPRMPLTRAEQEAALAEAKAQSDAAREAEGIAFDSMPADELLRLLGWTRPQPATPDPEDPKNR